MPSYIQYKKMMAVLDYDDSDIESWITVNGNHIPIKKGQTKEEAVKSFVEKKQGKSGSGEYKKQESKSETKKTPALQKGQVKLHRDIDNRDVIVDPDGAYTFYKDGVKGSQNRSLKGQEGALKELGEIGYKQNTNVITTPKHHEDLDKMLESVMAYGGHKMSPEDILSSGYHGQFLKDYVTKYGEEEVKEAIKDMQSKIDHIEHDVYTDSEGGSYNSIVWKKDTATAPKESESDMKKWDKEVTKYHDEEEKAEADFKKMRNSFGEHYDKLYKSQYLDDKYNYLVGQYEEKMEDPEFKKQVQKFVQARGDFISSDREIKAYMLALQDQEKAAQAPKAKNPDSPLVNAVAKALNKSPAEAEKEIEGAAQWVRDMMKANDLRNGDVEETLRGLGVESDYAEELLQWASGPSKKARKPRNSKKEPAIVKQNGVNWVDAKKWNDPRSDPWYALYN